MAMTGYTVRNTQTGEECDRLTLERAKSKAIYWWAATHQRIEVLDDDGTVVATVEPESG